MARQMQNRRGTAAEWTAANPILADGEMGVERDTYKIKIGDGVTAWNALAYFGGGASPLTTRGDLFTRGAAADARLAIGSANQVLGTDGTDPIWRSVATILGALATTRGDLITRDGSTVIRKALGAAYTRLMSDGTDPQWMTFKKVELSRTANQAIPANTDTAITWPTETFDTDAFHAANAAAIVIPAGLGGVYAVSGFVSFSSDGTGARHCWIGRNGAAEQLSYSQAPSGTTQRGLAVFWIGTLAVADTIELYVNTVGGTPNVNPAKFTAVFLGA